MGMYSCDVSGELSAVSGVKSEPSEVRCDYLEAVSPERPADEAYSDAEQEEAEDEEEEEEQEEEEDTRTEGSAPEEEEEEEDEEDEGEDEEEEMEEGRVLLHESGIAHNPKWTLSPKLNPSMPQSLLYSSMLMPQEGGGRL